MKQPGSGRERLVGDTVHDGTPQVTAPADAAAKDNHKLGQALRTETTINDTRDFGIGKRLTNLPALRRSASPPAGACSTSNDSATTPSPEPAP